jgi:hypothetical protein
MKLTLEFRLAFNPIQFLSVLFCLRESGRVRPFSSGGMELLFENAKKLIVEVPDTIETMKDLLPWIRDNRLKQRPELFMQGSTV